MRAPGGGILHDQRVVLAQAVGVGERRPADRARLRDGRSRGGRIAAVRVGVAAAGARQPEGLQVAAHGAALQLLRLGEPDPAVGAATGAWYSARSGPDLRTNQLHASPRPRD
jgi:hypothetical protein